MTIVLRPTALAEANAFVVRHHSHHRPVTYYRFSIGASVNGDLAGVAIVALPCARALTDGFTYEITRLTVNRVPHVASKLIAASWRAARAMGITRMVSYTRADEPGTCYAAAGWQPIATTRPRDWTDRAANGTGTLPGLYLHSTERVARVRWEVRTPERERAMKCGAPAVEGIAQ